MNTDELKKLCELLHGFSTAMLVTRTGGDQLRARPMALAQVEKDGTIWFISGKDTAKVHEIEKDTHVLLVMQKEHSVYLSINGTASTVHDPRKVADVWKESFRVWFPGGKDDENITLIAVEPADAEFWDNQGFKKVSYLVRAAKAYVTGQTPHIEEGKEHGVLAS